MITEVMFMEKLRNLLGEIDYEWDFGIEINGKIKELELLCHNYIHLRNKEKEDEK